MRSVHEQITRHLENQIGVPRGLAPSDASSAFKYAAFGSAATIEAEAAQVFKLAAYGATPPEDAIAWAEKHASVAGRPNLFRRAINFAKSFRPANADDIASKLNSGMAEDLARQRGKVEEFAKTIAEKEEAMKGLKTQLDEADAVASSRALKAGLGSAAAVGVPAVGYGLYQADQAEQSRRAAQNRGFGSGMAAGIAVPTVGRHLYNAVMPGQGQDYGG